MKFFIIKVSLIIFSAPIAWGSWSISCQKTPHFSRLIEIHSAFSVGEMVQAEELRQNILELSGRSPIDSQGCLHGRCDSKNKLRARQYLETRANELGLKADFEEVPASNFNFAMNESAVEGPLDLKTADFSLKEAIFSHKKYVWIKKVLIEGGFLSLRGQQLIGLEKINSSFISTLEKIYTALDSPHSTDKMARTWKGFAKSWSAISQSLELGNKPTKVHLLKLQLEDLIERIQVGGIFGTSSANRSVATNVIIEIPGISRADEIVEINAHYDTVPSSPGADDNGSGISAMLEMMRIFSQNPPQRTKRFVFTDLEEFGFIGSRYHTEIMQQRNDNVVAVFVVDTIGYAPPRPVGTKPIFVAELGTDEMYPDSSSFRKADIFARIVEEQFTSYDRSVIMSTETEGALPGTADHGSYIRRKFPAILFAAPFEADYKNPGYHNKGDTIENINWPYFLAISKFLTEAVAKISGAKTQSTDSMAKAVKSFRQLKERKDFRVTIFDKG